jgi:hypothetical protein
MRLSKRGSSLNWASSSPTLKHDTIPMPNAEFRQLCLELDIKNNVLAGELFGLSWRNCQRYWYGELAVPGPLARLLRLAAAQHLSHDDLRQLARQRPIPKVRRAQPPGIKNGTL